MRRTLPAWSLEQERRAAGAARRRRRDARWRHRARRRWGTGREPVVPGSQVENVLRRAGIAIATRAGYVVPRALLAAAQHVARLASPYTASPVVTPTEYVQLCDALARGPATFERTLAVIALSGKRV